MADDDFSTGAELEISVSQSSLSDARDTIESELGDLEVGVNAVVSGNGRQPRDPSSGQFMSIEGMEQRQVNTNDTLDSLIQIENERWELDKYRNDYLERLAEGGGVMAGGGSAGGSGSLMGARAAVGGGGLATLLGGLAVSGAGIFGGRTALASGLGGQTGRRVARQRQQLTGMSGIQMLQNNPGQAMAQSFKTMLDPSGIGETIATNVAQGIDSQTNLDEQIGQTVDTAFNNLSQSSWPPLPDLTQEFSWPDPPDFGTLFGGGQQGGPSMNRSREGLRRFGPNDSQQRSVEPTINLGGLTVDVTTTIDNAVDDAVDEVEQTIDQEVGELERRISDALGGFF